MKSPSAFILLVAGLVLCPVALAQDTSPDWVKIDTEPIHIGTYYVSTGTLVPNAAPRAPSAEKAVDIQAISASKVGATATNAGVYDYATGVLSNDGGVAKATNVIYDNTADNGYFFSGGPNIILMDWGSTATGGANEVVGFQMAYATSSATTVDMNVRLHDQATGFGDPGTAITTIGLTGLPGSDGVNVAAWIIDIDISGSPVTLADGLLGYSYEALDGVTGPLLAGPPNAPDVDNAFDEYDTAFNLLGTFWFGGTPMASFHMQLTANAPCDPVYDNTATNGYFFSGGPNIILMDWGDLGIQSDICEMEIAYATSSATTVDINMRLHDDATGFGDPGTAITTIPLTGLPGSDGVNIASWIVNVVLTAPVPLGPSFVGWSYEALDAVTGPLLIGPPNGAGVENAFDEYDTAFNPLGTFWFGGTPFASFYMLLKGTGTPPLATWTIYGTGKGMLLQGSGSGVPGDTQTLSFDGPLGANANLVMGLVESAVFDPVLDITHYAMPWDFRVDGLTIPFGGKTVVGTLPLGLPQDLQLFFEVYAQGFANWKHSNGLRLVVQ